MYILAEINVRVRVTGDKDGESVGGTRANCRKRKIREPEKWMKLQERGLQLE